MGESNSKRIAKNTILLYVRMLFLMLISLYTSRVILNALGIEDYGIYNVVGGIVAMFTMISGSLAAAISRFITFELGKGDIEKLKKIFSSSVTIQILLSLLFIVVAETIGLWFLNTKMVIPDNRMVAANWVYQFSILSFAINLVSVPYNAAIIAHEKMEAFAVIAILEAVFKLILAWIIALVPFDRLVFYALSLTIISVIVRLIYGRYCERKFEECKYRFIYDYDLLKNMLSFAGWNLIGASSAVCRDHGGNIILNLFFGPAVNASRGIAVQVNTAVQGFVQNFQMALNPQITKNYACGNIEYMSVLVFQGARLSYYILLFIALPIYMSTEYILMLWLGDYPAHTVSFLHLILIFTLVESLSGPLLTTMYATGNVKNYQIIVGGLQMLNLPIAYVTLKMGSSPESVFIVAIMVAIICLFARLIMLHYMVGLSVKLFFKKVFINVVNVTVISTIIPVLVLKYIEPNFTGFILQCIICFTSTVLSELYIGCNQNERKIVYAQICKFKNKILK